MTLVERRKYWEKQVNRWQASGMSMRAWCKAQDLSEKTVSRWKRKLAAEATSIEKAPKLPDGWCAITSNSEKQVLESGLKLEINGQIRIELNHGFDHNLLREVVEALTR